MIKPSVTIMKRGLPYLRRWWIIPRNKYFNIYLHNFVSSDEDRALHDHMYWSMSIILRGKYIEILQDGRAIIRRAGDIIIRRPEAAHRIELLRENEIEQPCWTLFITGPRVREWGFYCKKGWVHWKEFLGAGNYDGGSDGPGCGE